MVVFALSFCSFSLREFIGNKVFVKIRPTRNDTQCACGERSTWVCVGVTFVKKVVIRWGPADVGPYLQRIVYKQLRKTLQPNQ